MKLPFLKRKKLPKVATSFTDEKLVNGDSFDHIEDYCTSEMFDAIPKRNVKDFRKALEAFVLNMFDWDGDSDAADAG